MKTGIIRNPAAGGRLARRLFDEVERALRAHYPSLQVFLTEGAGHGTSLAGQLCDDGYDLVIAAGGDGTISAVADGILQSSRPQTPMSIIPSGTGSDFARNFRLPSAAPALAGRIATATPRPIDAGIMRIGSEGETERHFVNIASVGISGTIVRTMNNLSGRRVLAGSPRFLVHSIREILRYRPQKVRVVLDGAEVYRGPVTAVAVANGAWFGGGMHVVPDADPRDGLLDLGVMRSGSTLTVLDILRRLYSASHLDHRLMSFHRGKTVEIWPLDGDPVLIDADGEAPGEAPLQIEIRPSALMLKL